MNGFDISTISGIYVGSTPYSAIYKGSNLIWSAGPHDYSRDYFTIESLANNNTISVNNYFASTIAGPENGLTLTLYWSTDKVNWTSVTVSRTSSQTSATIISSTITTLNNGEKVYIKGNAPTGGQAHPDGRTTNSNYYNYFSSTANINVQGNIMSLLYGDNFENQTTLVDERCFQYLFYTNTYLIDASNLILPATTLANYCYYYMFSSCTSLQRVPELPATTLTNYCYGFMFFGCTSLTTVPELPATTLANYCYYNMFKGCTSLTTAPLLPVTTLANNCYYCMFYGCTSLTIAPELPATTLANYCYGFMFFGCTSLTTAPELPATTLAYDCYQYMFQNCTSLVNAPELPATTLANYCYESMFVGCTSLITAPELPATTLTNYCYYNMFKGCTSLTTAPVLPAIALASGCYNNMFYGCTSLNYIKALFTTTPSSSYTDNWVTNVATNGTFIKRDLATWSVTGDNAAPATWGIYKENAEPFIIVSKSNSNTISIENTLGSSFTLYYNGISKTISSSGTTTITTLSNNGIVRITATSSSITRSSSKYITIKATGDFIVQGNVMALLYSTNINSYTSVGSYQFYNLFKDNTYLKDASGLILPATTINTDAYDSMFRGCTSLVTPPRKLPAATFPSYTMYQYNSMFRGCTSLTTVPKLLNTTLSTGCYGNMFFGCTSLVKVPYDLLPATTLVAHCYNQMFYGCTSLTTAPDLPATTLVNNCYGSMFNGCTSLNQVVAMFTTDISSTTSYTDSWLYNVASSGTFYKNLEATWSRTDASGVPSGWTIVPVVPAIPI